MDGEAGWWTTSGNIGLPPLARAMGVGRQQQQHSNLPDERPSSERFHHVQAGVVGTFFPFLMILLTNVGISYMFIGEENP